MDEEFIAVTNLNKSSAPGSLGGVKIFINCNQCNEVFSEQIDLIGHLRTHSDEKPFQCRICDKVFSVNTDLNIHMMIHSEENPYQCSQCNKVFSQNNLLKLHMKTHTLENPYHCNQCDKTFSKQSVIIKHMRTHSQDKPHQCNQCDRAFSQNCNLKAHMRTHTGEKAFQCNQCDKAFSKHGNLNVHMRTHTGEKPFQCKQCDKDFSKNGHLKVHMRTHTGEKPFQCNQCDKAFSKDGDLKIHVRTHTGEKPFQCNQCDKAFSKDGDLKVHVRTHTGERPFQCNQCDKTFLQNLDLKDHIRTHTGEKTFQCNQCDKAFSKNGNLKVHMRTHTMEKPFQCNQCSKAFSKNGDLIVHMRTHTGEKLFQCNQCDKTFLQNCHLKDHMRTHTGEKPLQCNQFDKAFSKNGNLKVHMRTHIDEISYQCSKCDKAFSKQYGLNRHLKIHSRKESYEYNQSNTGDKPFQCKECNKSFPCNCDLVPHIKQQSEKETYQCSLCDMIFISNDVFKDHLRIHIVDKTYKCNHCDMDFAGIAILKEHLRTHSVETIFKCNQYDHLFSGSCDLIDHMETTHIGEKSYQCSHCYMAFPNNNDLLKHLKASNSDEIHQCSESLKDFSDNFDPDEHTGEKTNKCKHTGEKSYQCRHCEKDFSRLATTFDKVTIFDKESQSEIINFKGIRFINPLGENLCYINAALNAFLYCESVMILLQSAIKCEVITRLRYLFNGPEIVKSAETFRELMISKNQFQFENNTQMDVDEFIRCFLSISEPLSNLFKINMLLTFTCQECFELTYSEAVHIGLNEVITGNSIQNIIQNNRTSSIKFNCNKCNKNTNHSQKESFISLPDVLMIQVKRFEARSVTCIKPNNTIVLNNSRYNLKSIIVHQEATRDEGHYVVHLREKTDNWIKCNDQIIQKSTLPLNGYIYFYEKASICEIESASSSVICSFKEPPVSKQLKKNFFSEVTIGNNEDKMSYMHGQEDLNGETIVSKDNNLEKHLKTHPRKKSYQCCQCDKSFSMNVHLVRHMKTHTTKELYQCNQCNKAFSNKTYLLNHLRTHSGEKPYQCKQCDKSFSQNNNLRVHMRIHTGEKPYQCAQCDKAFSTVGNLNTHIRIHTRETTQQRQKDSRCDYLRNSRLEMLNEVKSKNKFECLFKENNILKGGEKMVEELREWKMQPKCNICEESWFDQKYHADLGICERCRKERYKDLECYTFSRENNMIPGPIPECLQVLNDIEEASIKLIKPFLHIYKRKGGGVGFKGNCISFAQSVDSFAKSLPWSVKDLPIIIIQSVNDTKQRRFCANATKIRKALLWLKKHHYDYRLIEINEDALKEYPETGGDLIGINTIDDPNNVIEQIEHQSINDDEFLQAVLDIEEQGDMPRPDSIVPEALQRDEISKMVKKSIDVTMNNSVAWPERGLIPENEYASGWWRKSFPTLFPDGKGDITSARLGKTVPINQWAEHLLKVDRRFAKCPLFVMVTTNMINKQKALTLGTLYANRKLSNMSAKELKEKLELGDYSVLKSLYCFSKGIRGTQQFFSQQMSKSVNFVRDLMISSNNEKMFNLFLTFSVADLHEKLLHEKLPGSDQYINKIVVKDLTQVPHGSDASLYIDEKTDYQLRMKTVNENIDIVNEYLIKKVDLLLKHVLKPELGGEHYICRFEFQNRGSIHCHMVMTVKHGPFHCEMELARNSLPNLDDCKNQEEKTVLNEFSERIASARKKIEIFNSHIIGVSAIHPEPDPTNWPSPYGHNIYKPANNVLREGFEDIKDNPSKLYEHYTFLVNRMMLHKCRMNYCLDPKRVTLEIVYGTDGQVMKGPNGKELQRRKYVCRFDFPMEMLGFGHDSDEDGKLENVTPLLDTEGNLEVNGSFHNGETLKLLRNHPGIVTHIPELLVIWGANTDQKTITSYQILLNYLLKYLMKSETQSDFFTNIAKNVTGKLDDEAPIRKSAQKILLHSVGQRDKSINECMLECHNKPYVVFSQTARTVNLKGSNKVKDIVTSKDDVIVETDNWQEAYWQRESCPGYQKLCEEFPTIFKYFKHPKDISLREFVKNFTKKWKYRPENVFPDFIPAYKYIVHKGKPHYEEYCKNLLLMDKPGCTLDNVGKEYESCEAELKDFVENSEFCPPLLKEDFEKSQTLVKENNNQQSVDGDAFDELYIELNPVTEKAAQDAWMECFALDQDGEFNPDNYTASDDEGSEYDEAVDGIYTESHDWQADCESLKLSASDIKEGSGWIDQKKNFSKLSNNDHCQADKANLNPKQLLAYAFITAWIDKKVENPNATNPFYLNISGRAGCGKSYFLNCISKYASQKGGDTFLQKAAPTGTAAFLIGGNTLHGTFKLHVQSSTKKELPDLNGEALRELQDHFKYCELLVIDEKSMVGMYMLYMIDKRLREIKPTNAHLSFGGISVILMGDFAQLPPIGDKPLFYQDMSEMSSLQCIGKTLFNLFEKTIIFNQIMRQQGEDQKEFREVLDRLSNDQFTKEDWKFLKQRELYGDGNLSESEREQFLANSTMICAYNRDLKAYNIKRIKDLGTPIALIKSQNSDKVVASFPSSKAQGLPSQVMLAKECQVILTVNLWKEAGLTNGAKGIVKYIVYEGNVKPTSLPSMVIIQFPQYIGPSYLSILEKCVPIVPIMRNWYMSKKNRWRIMLPLKPAYATSIHSCQGKSLDRVIINLGKTEFANGLTYTAISRCKKFEYLSFCPMKNYSRFALIKKGKTFKDRLKQDKKEKDFDKEFDLSMESLTMSLEDIVEV